MGENLSRDDYSSLPTTLQQVHWRVTKVEEDLEKECVDRKKNDEVMFDKFDKLNDKIIYQLCAALLTLLAVLAVYIKG